MSLRRIFQAIAVSVATILPEAALAFEGTKNTLTVDFVRNSSGGSVTFTGVVGNVLTALIGVAGTFCAVLFLIGAFLVVTAKQTNVDKGKDLMIQSMIGLAVTLSAYAILRTFFSVLY